MIGDQDPILVIGTVEDVVEVVPEDEPDQEVTKESATILRLRESLTDIVQKAEVDQILLSKGVRSWLHKKIA